MDIVIKEANDFWQNKGYMTEIWKDFASDLHTELYKFQKEKHKVIYIKTLIDLSKEEYEIHKKNCSMEICREDEKFKKEQFFLNQELDKFSEIDNEDEIDYSQRISLDKKIDIILDELEKMKIDNATIQKGQLIIIEAMTGEFDEMKLLYYLGKKTWRQVFFGKVGEMIVSGIVSETLSKEIIEVMKEMGNEVKQMLISN
jgi:hypothetical protein